jgi:DNA-binding NarL/FixJ family response regulator
METKIRYRSTYPKKIKRLPNTKEWGYYPLTDNKKLTPTENKIFQLMGKGMLYKNIAAQLGTSEQTVKNHVREIFRKTGTVSRNLAVIKGIQDGVIVLKPILIQYECPTCHRPYKKIFSDREEEILSDVIKGLTNKNIASQRGISEQTVKNHVTSIYKKTGFTNRSSLIINFLAREKAREVPSGMEMGTAGEEERKAEVPHEETWPRS